ncbi:MAG: GMC family oxidoreductase [Bryobacteraceae bacterium]
MKPAYDFVIIGSGFGGSVSAYRLTAEQRRLGRPASVCVMERGKRYLRGQFPRDVGRPKDFLFRDEGRDGWHGIFDWRSGDNISVLCGNGVGGGSLVYLDVQVDAFASTFDIVGPEGRKRWPSSVNWHAEMPGYYARMEAMLRPSPIPDPALKTIALREAAHGAGMPERFKLVDLAVFWGRHGGERGVVFHDPYERDGPPQGACQMCGECFLGCNTHSKNTLDLNYLWFAERAGAEVFAQHRVTRVEPRPGGGYTVYFDDLAAQSSGSVAARNVVVSAGTTGSTELMLKCKYGYRNGRKRFAPTMPRISDMLGRYFSGNGDFGAVAFQSRRVTEPGVGPTITAAVDCRDLLDGHGFYIEDGGIPEILRANLRLYPGGLSTGQRVMHWLRGLVSKRTPASLAEQVFDLLDLEGVRNALVYLTMGIDAADGVMSIDQEGRLQIHWEHTQSMRYLREVEGTLRAISETPVPGSNGPGIAANLMLNPAWSFNKHLLTLHPLGGCPMGDDETMGVVSPAGEVFNYPGLYITDGSIIPTALGPNPSKTIGAVSERVGDHIIAKGI